jgi:hypothetical protein
MRNEKSGELIQGGYIYQLPGVTWIDKRERIT